MAKHKAPLLGIDLGTTRSVVAFLDANGKPETIRNREGDLTTPSVVLFEENELTVGKEALKALSSLPENVATFVKREMGKESFSMQFGGDSYSPELISASVLERLRLDAEAKFGCKVQQAVVSVPAYFDESKRLATINAGLLAGLDVLAIINEPTAAALAFASNKMPQQDSAEPSELNPESILVYDLGGGTFDVSIVKLEGADFVVQATDGNARLGGLDWDKCLAAWLDDQFEASHSIRPSEELSGKVMLMREAEEIKKSLTARQQCRVRLVWEGLHLNTVVKRSEFEELTAHLLDRTCFTVRYLLQENQKTWKDIDRVVLVGGSTRMPQVAKALQRESGKLPEFPVSADEAVAHGAAIYANAVFGKTKEKEGKDTLKVIDVNAHDLGVLGHDRDTKRRCNHMMIKRNTPLPASHVARFDTIRQDQRSVVVEIVEGGDRRGIHSNKLGRFVVDKLPAGLPEGTPVDVLFRYDRDGLITVEARLPTANRYGKLTIDRAFPGEGLEFEKMQEIYSALNLLDEE
ncbi:MAG: Hsp70 family protein [Rubripirellula sp.]|jgi:molecular chaperone DnaK